MSNGGLLTAWASHHLNILAPAEISGSWPLHPYQAELIRKLREQIKVGLTIITLDEARIVDPPSSTRIRDALKQLTFADRYHTQWQSSIHRFQSERNASPQKPNWRLKPTLQNSTRSGTAFMDLCVPKSHAPLNYLCSLVRLDEKEQDIPPSPLLVDRPQPKKASAIQGRVSRVWR